VTYQQIKASTVFPDGVHLALIEFDPQSGTIAAVERIESVDRKDRLLFPGFMDIHVHAREYPRPDPKDAAALARWEKACNKETFSSAGHAAVNGGVTLFCAMPNDPNPPSNESTYGRKLEIARTSECPVILFAAITRSSEPWSDRPYKVYLDNGPSAVSFDDWGTLEEALGRYRGCRVFFHAEDPQELAVPGTKGPRWFTRPPRAERSAVEKILNLTGKLGLKSHICHVSTESAVRLIHEYNSGASIRVTCEVTPHHLFFSVDEGKLSAAIGGELEEAPYLECNPPLRSENDRRFLLYALREGLVDVLASDHAPHTRDDKAAGAPGMPHLDTMGAFAGWLIKDVGFTPQRVAEVLSSVPASIFSLDLSRTHGRLEEGCAASLTELDLSGETLVRGDRIEGRGKLRTLCGWSPFSGIPLPAAVAKTYVLGREYKFGPNSGREG
jgi:dihydroorotase